MGTWLPYFFQNDFWNMILHHGWTKKAISGNSRALAVDFSIGSKGILVNGYTALGKMISGIHSGQCTLCCSNKFIVTKFTSSTAKVNWDA